MKIKSIRTRLLAVVGVTAVGLAIVTYIGASMIKDTMLDASITRTGNLAQVAVGVAKSFDDRVKKGEIDQKAAKEGARALLESLHYGAQNNQYFFSLSMDGTSTINGGDPSQDGSNPLTQGFNDKDPNGRQRTEDMIAVARTGAGHVFYSFQRPGGTVQVPKVSSIVTFEPWQWFFGTGTYIDDIEIAFWHSAWRLAGASALILAIAAAITVLLSRTIASPMRQLAVVASRISEGDYSVEVPAADRADEVGTLANAILILRDRAKVAEQERRAHEESLHAAEKQRRDAMLGLADKFDAKVGTVVKSVSTQATQMVGSAQTLSSTAEDATKQASNVAAASEQASANVQTVAAATEELSSSIGEISRQVAQSSKIANTAVGEADKANQMVQGLLQASQKIGDVVALITDIANQTNLLALNATIEAARAGEAGKGFAVVAAEVKNLANQTAKATEEIGVQITGVQNATQGAVEAIETIAKTIGEINSISATIAAAVEEQSAATKEIARNVEQASHGTTEVTSNIASVTQAANDTGSAASQVLASAQDLTRQSESLRSLVAEFLTDVKAA